MNPIPWTERLSPFRAPLDILCGSYPFFAFGGPLNPRILPVFHFHEVTPSYLEPYLRYLRENGYRSAGVDELLAVLGGSEPIRPKTVVLTFDDAWTSLWTVAAPLLRRYDLRAITFAIPGRVSAGSGCRGTIQTDPGMADFGDRGEEPFCRWDELVSLDKEGIIEVESHTFAHEQIPVAVEEGGTLWTEEVLEEIPLLSRPLIWKGSESFRVMGSDEIGEPRRVTRSRMSDGRKIGEDGSEETPAEQRAAIRRDLTLCRGRLEERLGRPARILCFPWAVAGKIAREEAREVDFRAAFSDWFPGKRYVRAGDETFRLMRLKHNWIYQLPGKGRRRIPLPK